MTPRKPRRQSKAQRPVALRARARALRVGREGAARPAPKAAPRRGAQGGVAQRPIRRQAPQAASPVVWVGRSSWALCFVGKENPFGWVLCFVCTQCTQHGKIGVFGCFCIVAGAPFLVVLERKTQGQTPTWGSVSNRSFG